MSFNNETTVKEIALANPAATKILEDAGVDYCCGGDKSLRDACAHAGVSSEEILERLRTNLIAVTPTDANWLAAPLAYLTRHIRDNHHRYVREAIPRVGSLLTKVKAKHGENHAEIAQIETFFIDLGREMVMHMQKEEQILFPYIESLERSLGRKETLEPPFFLTVRNPIHAMMKEHDSAGDLLKHIRDASSNFTPPPDACESFKALYRELSAFEKDLHQHVHLENNILFPRAVEMEAAVPVAGGHSVEST
jgi:regulator of cell morphogenesis and NO signaling